MIVAPRPPGRSRNSARPEARRPAAGVGGSSETGGGGVLLGGGVVHERAADVGVAGGGRSGAADRPNPRRLPTAGGPTQRKDLPAAALRARAVGRRYAAIFLGDVVEE